MSIMAAGEIWIPPFDPSFMDMSDPFDAIYEVQRIIANIPEPEAQAQVAREVLSATMSLTNKPIKPEQATIGSSLVLLTDKDAPKGSADELYDTGVVGCITGIQFIRRQVGRRTFKLALTVAAERTYPLAHPDQSRPTQHLARMPIERIHFIEFGDAA